jgi:hypothetical protein
MHGFAPEMASAAKDRACLQQSEIARDALLSHPIRHFLNPVKRAAKDVPPNSKSGHVGDASAMKQQAIDTGHNRG